MATKLNFRDAVFRSRRSDESFEVGGFLWAPNYAASYLLAAERLLEGTSSYDIDRIGIPTLFLQRHALELAIKSLIETTYSIHYYSAWTNAPSKHGPPRGEIELSKVPDWHCLKSLLGELESELQTIGSATLPRDFATVVSDIEAIEGTGKSAHTRLRYPHDRSNCPSFREALNVPVKQLQEKLVQLFNNHILFDCEVWRDSEDWNFAESLAWENQANWQAYYTAGGPY